MIFRKNSAMECSPLIHIEHGENNRKRHESYLLLDYGLPEWDFDKQIVLKITKFDQFTLILTLYKNVTEMEII